MVLALLATLLAAAAAPAPDSDRAGFEEEVLADLAARDAGAELLGRDARDAFLAGRWQEADDRYQEVLAAVPGFHHALRRQGLARGRLGDRAGAVERCRAALQRDATAENRMALAVVLAGVGAPRPAPPGDLPEAVRLAKQAFDLAPQSALVALQACEVAVRGDLKELLPRQTLRVCAWRLGALAPGTLDAARFQLAYAFLDGNYEAARRHLEAARAAGLPADEAARIAVKLEEREPAWSRHWRLALWILGGWAGALALLLGLGAGLSAVTARMARRLAAEPGSGWAPRLLRAIYAVVLWLTAAAFYLSLPLVVGSLLLVGYATWLLFRHGGTGLLKLEFALASMVVVSLWAVLRSLWATLFRRQASDPGLRLDPAAHPRFASALAEAARRVGTRPVDVVFLTPGTDMAVFEDGSVGRQLSGRCRRCLVLGIGLLDGMTQGQLKSVLAHEYGHFVNRDTAGGRFALAVRRSMLHLGQALASGGAAAWYNPAWLFVTEFHKLFLRVSQGASRLQEILADRWAALAYGGRTFGAAMTHTVARAVRFEHHVEATLREVVDRGLGLPNLYRFAPATPPDEAAVAAAVRQVMEAEPSPYDSHPRPVDRIAWAGAVASPNGAGLDGGAPAWALFSDREALERRLTGVVRDNVKADHGVEIPAEAPALATAPAAAEAEAASEPS